MSKIVIITSSPRISGNSNAMATAFVEAAEQIGHTVVRFDAAFLNVSGCKDCASCFSSEDPCIIDDDFNALAREIMDADGIVFAMPVYWYSTPAQLKAVIDRMYCFLIGGKDLSGKKCAIIACCGDEDSSVFEGACAPPNLCASYYGWEVVGSVLVPSVLHAGAIEGTDGCQQASELARLF